MRSAAERLFSEEFAALARRAGLREGQRLTPEARARAFEEALA